MKTCSKCGINQSESQFYRRKSASDGMVSHCKTCAKSMFSSWYAKNRERNIEKKKKWIEENRDRHANNALLWYRENKDRFNETRASRDRVKRKSDHDFIVMERCRKRVYQAIRRRNVPKEGKTKDLIGADWSTVSKRIESLFVEGMSWDNHGEWHIDHIVPLSSASSEEEMFRLMHYTNLQPLWAGDNIKKGGKIENSDY